MNNQLVKANLFLIIIFSTLSTGTIDKSHQSMQQDRFNDMYYFRFIASIKITFFENIFNLASVTINTTEIARFSWYSTVNISYYLILLSLRWSVTTITSALDQNLSVDDLRCTTTSHC